MFFKWMKDRFDTAKGRKLPVVNLIRAECTLFAGVGLYTVCEIFHLAGKHNALALTKWWSTRHSSLFIYRTMPFHDRTGILAFAESRRSVYTCLLHLDWTDARNCSVSVFFYSEPCRHTQLNRRNESKIVKQHVYEWKLAVGHDDNTDYLKHLDVFGKPMTSTSRRYQISVNSRNVSDLTFVFGQLDWPDLKSKAKDGTPSTSLKDCWEPSKQKSALEKFPSLESAAFGEHLSRFESHDDESKSSIITEADELVSNLFIPFWKDKLGIIFWVARS